MSNKQATRVTGISTWHTGGQQQQANNAAFSYNGDPETNSSAGTTEIANPLDDPWLGEGIESMLEAVPSPERFYLAVTQVSIKKKTAGGILLPDQVVADQEWTSGAALVVKVGPSCFKGRRFEDIGLSEADVFKPGDVVHFNAGGSPRRLHVDGRLFLFITDDSVISRIDRKHLHRIKFTI